MAKRLPTVFVGNNDQVMVKAIEEEQADSKDKDEGKQPPVEDSTVPKPNPSSDEGLALRPDSH